MPTIMVVDDDPQILRATARFLSIRGFNVIQAGGGEEALRATQDFLPDLFLVDAKMPDISGHALCDHMKKDPTTANIPVIIMSGAWIEGTDIQTAYQIGADDYILKPFSVSLLLDRIRAALQWQDAGSYNS